MTKSLDTLIAGLPKRRQRRIAARAAELATLQDLRKQRGLTQDGIAEVLGVGQETVSRIENRDDMLVSTLRRYVESLGGRLECVACFPDNARIVIDESVKAARRRRSKAY